MFISPVWWATTTPQIYHCNINSCGRICHEVLTTGYTPSISVREILGFIYGLLMVPEPNEPLDTCVFFLSYSLDMFNLMTLAINFLQQCTCFRVPHKSRWLLPEGSKANTRTCWFKCCILGINKGISNTYVYILLLKILNSDQQHYLHK